MTSSSFSRLELEAREQGEMLAARTSPGWEAARAAAEILGRDDVDQLVIAARGTSDNAARYGQYLLGSTARLPVALAAPWLYSGDRPPLLRRAAVMAISQSGRSPDIVAVISAAGEQRCPTIALTNDPGSPVGRAAHLVVPLLAGAEQAVAATKTYLASLHALAQIALSLDPYPSQESWFERLPEVVSATVEEQFAARSQFDALSGISLLTVVGRGLQLPTAYETALKVREISGIAAEAFSLPDLMHGPVAALRRSGAVWLLSTESRERPDSDTLARLQDSAGHSVVVSDRDDLLARAEIAVRVPAGLPAWAAPLVAVVPGQAAALRLGELRGVDVDQPPGLTKVTLTR